MFTLYKLFELSMYQKGGGGEFTVLKNQNNFSLIAKINCRKGMGWEEMETIIYVR